MDNTQEKYQKLKELLEENKKWPLRYMFKFIIPNKDGNVDKAKELIPEKANVKYKNTTSLKYVSLTCVAYMKSVDEIIALTKKMEAIPGVISL